MRPKAFLMPILPMLVLFSATVAADPYSLGKSYSYRAIPYEDALTVQASLTKAFSRPMPMKLIGISIERGDDDRTYSYLYLSIQPHGQDFFANTKVLLDRVRVTFTNDYYPTIQFKLPTVQELTRKTYGYGPAPCTYAQGSSSYEGKPLEILLSGCLQEITIAVRECDWPPKALPTRD